MGKRRRRSAPAPSLGAHRAGSVRRWGWGVGAAADPQAAVETIGREGSGLPSSPPDPGNPPASLASRCTPLSLAAPSARWQKRAGNGRVGDRPGTSTLRRPPARRGGARRRWRSPSDGCSRARSHSLFSAASGAEAIARYPLPEPKQKRCSSEMSPDPANQPQQVPAHTGWRGARSSRTRNCRATKPREARTLPSPYSPRLLSRAARAAVGAGVSPSEQSPRPAVSAGTCTRTPPSAPGRHWGVTPAGVCSGEPRVQPSSPSRPNSAQRARQAGLPG